MYGKPLFQDCQISLALRRHNKSSPGISTDKKGRKEEEKYWRRRKVFNITDPLRLSHTRISPEFMGENIGLRVFSHGFLCKVRCCFELKKRYDNPWWIYKDFFMFRFWSFWHPRLWNEMQRQLFVLKFEMLKRTVPRKKGILFLCQIGCCGSCREYLLLIAASSARRGPFYEQRRDTFLAPYLFFCINALPRTFRFPQIRKLHGRKLDLEKRSRLFYPHVFFSLDVRSYF